MELTQESFLQENGVSWSIFKEILRFQAQLDRTIGKH
jgi:hypothetical protein